MRTDADLDEDCRHRNTNTEKAAHHNLIKESPVLLSEAVLSGGQLLPVLCFLRSDHPISQMQTPKHHIIAVASIIQ